MVSQSYANGPDADGSGVSEQFAPADGVRLGIDLGGTKIESVLLSADGTRLHKRRIAAPRGDYAATLSAIATLVRDAEAVVGTRLAVGVGIPGSLSPETGLVRGANSVWLNGKPLDADLHAQLHRPVRIANDADCFALSEATDGAAANARIAFGVILGTGVGGGLVVDGTLVTGAGGMAGEWGHCPFPGAPTTEGAPRMCWCGKVNCIETWLSGPGLLRGIAPAHRPARVEDLITAAASGDQEARNLLAKYPGQLARALALLINVLDPDVIVLGGGLSNLSGLPHAVEEALPDMIFADRLRCRIAIARHGDSSGVRGAARLWPLPATPDAK